MGGQSLAGKELTEESRGGTYPGSTSDCGRHSGFVRNKEFASGGR